MPRLRITPALVALTLAVVGLVSGCSSDDDEPVSKAESTSPETGATTAPPQGGRKSVPKDSKAQADRRKEADRKREAREQQELEKEDREFDRSFKETRFEKLTAGLPIRKPPLFVEQYTTDGTSTVQIAVNEKRFLCGTAPAKRKQAVAALYADAEKLSKRGGVKGLVIVVAPLAETAKKGQSLAVAKGGSVSLTARGRGRGPC